VEAPGPTPTKTCHAVAAVANTMSAAIRNATERKQHSAYGIGKQAKRVGARRITTFIVTTRPE
jgi:hypothetical protein